MNHLRLFTAVLIGCLFFTACQKEEVSTIATAELDYVEQLQEKVDNGEIQVPTVQVTTLEELNIAMTAADLPSIAKAQSEEAKANERATPRQCFLASVFGDLNGDGSVDVQDVVFGTNLLNQCGIGGVIDVKNRRQVTCLGRAAATVTDAAIISFPNRTTIFNDQDLQIIIDFLLGNCDD